ncbi:MAG: hypothetical protein R3A10_09870 [Caldilineaceae bacterium]
MADRGRHGSGRGPLCAGAGRSRLPASMSTAERTLWLWFGAGMLLAIFFHGKAAHPCLHLLPAVAHPLRLDRGAAVAAVTQPSRDASGVADRQRDRGRIGARLRQLRVLVLHIHNRTEVLRNSGADWHPSGYLDFYDEPDNKALFGFPLANGWKVVGRLYEEGVISGDYETNEKEAWVPAVHPRPVPLRALGRLVLRDRQPGAVDSGDQAQMEHFLRHGFSKWGIVEINATDRMVIYQRTGAQSDMPTEEPTDDVPRLRLDDFTARLPDRAAWPSSR